MRRSKPNDREPGESRERTPLDGQAFPLVLFFLFLMLLVKTAWVGDDAYITLRTVDNFVHGLGLTWNAGERVQSFTHPLWMLMLSAGYVVWDNAYFVALLLGFGCSLAAFGLLLFRVPANRQAVLVAATVLLLSKSFIDYSTSGLENPLTHLLLALFVVVLFRPPDLRSLGWLTALASLMGLTRIDALPMLAPAWLFHLGAVARMRRGAWRPVLGAVTLGALPFVAWELFSLVYYGFPFPNTAYAKLHTGIPAKEKIVQGFCYLLDTFRTDPLLLPVTLWAMTLAWFRRDGRERALVVGMGLFTIYLVAIGGDFMAGRFLTPLLFLAMLLLARSDFRQGQALMAMAVLGVVGLSHPLNPVLSGKNYELREFWPHNGITDERGWFYQTAGLLKFQRDTGTLPTEPHSQKGRALRAEAEAGPGPLVLIHDDGTIGYFSFEAGPRVYIIDPFALTDPLLARMPADGHFLKKWRIGHFTRTIPGGYYETRKTGIVQFDDPELGEYYRRLSTIIHGPIFRWNRWVEIVKMNLGAYDRLVRKGIFRAHCFIPLTGSRTLMDGTFSDAAIAAKPGADAPGCLVHGQMLRLERGKYRASFRLRADARVEQPVATLRVEWHHGKGYVVERTLQGTEFPADGGWARFDLDFEIPQHRSEDVEFRVQFLGAAGLAFDEIALAPRR